MFRSDDRLRIALTSLIDQSVITQSLHLAKSKQHVIQNTDLIQLFIIISVLFNNNLEAKTQRYVTHAIHETRGRKKLKKALCLPIY